MKQLISILLTLFVVFVQSNAEPVITRQPTNQSVSLGASVRFQVSATTTNPPILFQWRFMTTNVLTATTPSLTVTNVQITNAGNYDAVLTDGSGSVTSRVALLEVDPTFTKITSGRVVTDGGFSFAGAWGDYNNDGWVDLFVANDTEGSNGNDFLYRNNHDGSFTRITSGPVVSDAVWTLGGAWADYNNDGNLDLFVASAVNRNLLYTGKGDGTFTKVTTGLIVTEVQGSHAGAWGDYDNDGFVDLFIANFPPTGAPAKENVLYHNNGDGTFAKMIFGTKPAGNRDSWNAAWSDYDNDGRLDLFVPNGGTNTRQRNFLYRNLGEGIFELLTAGAIVTNRVNSVACAWGDYDNDGFLDLFVSNFYGQNNFLYHNNGDGTFLTIANSVVTLDGGTSVGCAWGDYDNDGWLDLFVANVGPVDPNTFSSIAPENNFLYHNNGDGTFTKIRDGSLVNDLGYSTGCAWGDYDNDGFLDLFVANGWVTQNQNNFLYRNNGNSNNWLNFKLVGTASNRAAIGAKVRVKATIGGKAIWQMRELSGGSNYGSQNDLRANFGLGGATNVDMVRIEWPSGIVQKMTNVATNQFLTVVEHQAGSFSQPLLKSAEVLTNGTVAVTMTGETGLHYVFEGSTNLLNWTWLGTRTNAEAAVQFTDRTATNFNSRFYRALVP